MSATDEEVRTWLQQVMKAVGKKPTPFAKAAGLAPSTVLRALDPEKGTSLERQSIKKIVEKFGVPGPGAPRGENGGSFHEPELAEYDAGPPNRLTQNEYERILQTRALDLIGYMPGDLLTLDMAKTPAANDVVAAQKYAAGFTSAETILRLYVPPYLVVRTTDPDIDPKPLLVDGEAVRIVAVCTKLVRNRKDAG